MSQANLGSQAVQGRNSAHGSVASVEDIQYPMENAEFDNKSIRSDARKSDGNLSKKAPSTVASSADSSVTSGNGKQIADTVVRKLIYMSSLWMAFALHIIYMVILMQLHSDAGMVLPFNYYAFGHSGPIVLEVIGLACHVCMDFAINDCLAALFGWLLTRKEGYSIVACGFVHSGIIGKVTFPNKLSYRSSAKPFLTKLSLVYTFHLVMVLLTFVAATGVETYKSKVDQGSLMCVLYSQNGTRAMDRGLPTIAAQMGVAELIDATGVGYLRRVKTSLPNSLHLVPPQLTGSCVDGSTIKGPGFATNVSTTCQCVNSASEADLKSAGVNSSLAKQMSDYSLEYRNIPGWVNAVTYQNKSVNITTVLTGTKICGGFNLTHPAVPVCKTKFFNQKNALVMVTYKTDGYRSIAARLVEVVEYWSPADMDWMYQSVHNLFGSTVSRNRLPSHWPGAVNPMLWLATQNMQDITIGLLDSGMEAAMVYVSRAAIQRSYTVTGSTCIENVMDKESISLHIGDYAFVAGILWIVGQFVVNILFFAFTVPWIIQPSPIFPAVEAAGQNIMFSLLSAKNAITASRIRGMGSNMEKALMWPRLDLVLRIGESVLTAEDPERGVILMDRPKMVTDMTYEKAYV